VDAFNAKGVRCINVELGADGAAEWMDGRRVVFVPREAILGIDASRGIAGERPALQVLFGLAAFLLGLLFLSSLAGAFDLWWRGAATRSVARLAAAGAPLTVIGAWVLWTGLRPSYYLRVRTATDARKLLLARKVNLTELSMALYEASQRFGYPVAWAIEEPRPPVTRPSVGAGT
jgi:hypothetical protein